jgi:serine/threonine protein phosphatase PrpC
MSFQGSTKLPIFFSSSVIGGRPYQEDLFLNVTGDGVTIAGVTDGHKPPDAPNDAANFACTMFPLDLINGLKSVPDHMPDTEVIELVVTLFREGNEHLRLLFPECKSGTTIAFGIIVGNRLIVCSVGDSDVLVEYHDGSFHYSPYHTPGNGNERKRVKAAGGYLKLGRLYKTKCLTSSSVSVTRAFGDFDFTGLIPDPDVTIHKLSNVKTVCFLSDGVRETMNRDFQIETEEDIRRILMRFANEAITSGKDPAVVLTTYAVEGRSNADNASAVVLSFPPPPSP